jgi:hypothetical protein
MCRLLTGPKGEGSTIPEVVPVKGMVPEIHEDHEWFEDRWMVASLCDE